MEMNKTFCKQTQNAPNRKQVATNFKQYATPLAYFIIYYQENTLLSNTKKIHYLILLKKHIT